MTCPLCALVSPEGARVCDCGYDFETRTGGVRVSLWKRYRTILLFISPIILGLLAWALFYAFRNMHDWP
jgi:hypothetical protein